MVVQIEVKALQNKPGDFDLLFYLWLRNFRACFMKTEVLGFMCKEKFKKFVT